MHVSEMNESQCQLARAAVQLGVLEVAEDVGVTLETAVRMEEQRKLCPGTVDAIGADLETAGTEVTNGDAPEGAQGDTMTTQPSKSYRAIFQARLRRTRDSWQASHAVGISCNEGCFKEADWVCETHIFNTDEAGARWLSAEAQAPGFEKEKIVWK